MGEGETLLFRYYAAPQKNEILADARKKSAEADEIFGFASDEIKSTLRRSDFIRAKREFRIAKQYFIHPQGWI